MHLKYEHKELTRNYKKLKNMQTRLLKKFLSICLPKTEFLAKSNTFVCLTGNVIGLP